MKFGLTMTTGQGAGNEASLVAGGIHLKGQDIALLKAAKPECDNVGNQTDK
jgi:hypothetical protein